MNRSMLVIPTKSSCRRLRNRASENNRNHNYRAYAEIFLYFSIIRILRSAIPYLTLYFDGVPPAAALAIASVNTLRVVSPF